MSQIRVQVLGALTKPFGQDDFVYEVDEDLSLEDLLLRLGYERSHLRFIVAAVNGSREKLSYRLRDADVVTLVLPTSGG
jgi:molybdopterin converting factor small subunit